MISISDLYEIKDFIQKVSEAIAHSVEIESSIVDANLNRVAGTVKEEKAESRGVIRKIIETGQYHIVDHPGEDIKCKECTKKHECNEKAFIHCPIFLNGKVIGVMGLMCFDDIQRQRLISKKDSLLSFIQGMCELISSKLIEHEMYKKIERHNIMLNHTLNTMSDGYIIINSENRITNVNKYALRLLGLTKNEAYDKDITEILPMLNINNFWMSKEYTYYDEVNINGKMNGLFITAMKEDEVTAGAMISFKKVDKISNRIYSKAFETKIITFDDILGQSKKIIDAKELAKTVSVNGTNILLLGESGTGKELFARAIHNASRRSDNPFIPVNCAAIPRELLESELFGYDAGAFTGASKTGKPGKFELADRGTIFLDEIGDMPFYLQAKILRVLQDKTIEKVGGITQQHIDVRIIAATNKNLESMVREGKFRQDLYYRLNVIPINIPSLKERKEDIKLLVEYFLDIYSKAFNINRKQVNGKVIERLEYYDWPGNVRELENIIQYLISLSSGDLIDESVLPDKFLYKQNKDYNFNNYCEQDMKIVPLEEVEKNAIINALKICGNSTEGKLRAARELGISKTTLYKKLGDYKDS